VEKFERGTVYSILVATGFAGVVISEDADV
jgi:hypothetical protein